MGRAASPSSGSVVDDALSAGSAVVATGVERGRVTSTPATMARTTKAAPAGSSQDGIGRVGRVDGIGGGVGEGPGRGGTTVSAGGVGGTCSTVGSGGAVAGSSAFTRRFFGAALGASLTGAAGGGGGAGATATAGLTAGSGG